MSIGCSMAASEGLRFLLRTQRTVIAIRRGIAQSSESHAQPHHRIPERSSKPRSLPSNEIRRIWAAGEIAIDRDISRLGDAVLTLKELMMAKVIQAVVHASAINARAVA